MINHPLVSIVLAGNCAISQIDFSLNSLKEVKYPQDQLEYFLIAPAYRPISTSMTENSKLRIIRFGEALPWSSFNAYLEGFSFAKGEYIQFLDCFHGLHPKWIKTALQHFQNKAILGVINQNQLKDEKYLNSNPVPSMNKTKIPVSLFREGLYDTNSLKQYFLSRNRSKTQFFSRVFAVTDPMCTKTNYIASHAYAGSTPLSNKIKYILSKYVLAR